MKKYNSFQTFKSVSVSLVLAMLLTTSSAFASTPEQDLLTVQKQWAEAMYSGYSKKDKYKALQSLSKQINGLSQKYANNAEIATWDGIILSSFAGVKGGVGGLSLAKEALKKLEHAHSIDPNVLNGSALTSMGTLYAKVPRWPLGFGNKGKAEAYFTKALKVNPNGIDPNYFYAEFLASQDKKEQAISYLQKALAAPARPNRPLADAGRRQEVQQLLSSLQKSS